VNPSAEDALAHSAEFTRGTFPVHVAWTFAARIFMLVNSVVAGIIVARTLGAEGLGTLAAINVTLATITQISTAGLPSANTYFVARDRRFLGPVAVNSFLFAIVVGGFLALCVALLARSHSELFYPVPSQLLTIAAIAIPFQIITLLGLNIFLATGRVERFNILETAGQSFVLINAVLVLILLHRGLWLLVLLNTATAVLGGSTIAFLVLTSGEKEPAGQSNWAVDFSLLKRLMGYGVKFHVATVAAFLVFRLDLLVVNHFRGPAEAGVYSVSSQVAMMLLLLPSIIAALLFPRLAATQDNRGALASRASRHTAFVMFLVCSATVPLSLLLPLLYGPHFKDLPVQLFLLLPGVYLISIESVMVQHLNAAGIPPAIPLFWIATLGVNLTLTLALVPKWGARGAAIASTLSYAMIFLLVLFYFCRKTGNRISSTLVLRAQELRELLSTGTRRKLRLLE